MNYLSSTNEVKLKDKILILDESLVDIIRYGNSGLFILDFSRKFEDGNLLKLPAKFARYNSLQDMYLIKKYNVVLGEWSDICLT
ncbi:MAG: hypothetical protein Q8936_12700 [Bacillota bacterium]|nr:hypothetical protein [Bacillota bacterium]